MATTCRHFIISSLEDAKYQVNREEKGRNPWNIQNKLSYLHCLSHAESPDGTEVGTDIHTIKGVTNALVLTHLNLANSTCRSKTKQWERLTRVYCIKPYTYTHVGLSALLVSTYKAMREPRCVERVREWLHVFFSSVNKSNN